MAVSREETYTLADFEHFLTVSASSERLYELIDGVISEKHYYTDECSQIAGMLVYHLGTYVIEHRLGLPGPSRTFRFPGDDYNGRTPNVSMIVDPDVPLSTERVMAYVPEFIAEIRTADDTIESLCEKAQFYVSCGVRLTWLIFPRQQIVEVYRPDQDMLDGYDVLPDFSLAVAELFPEKRG